MKNFFLIIFFSIAFWSPSSSMQFEFIPISIDFNGLEIKNDTIIVWGNFGSCLVSVDGGNNWEQRRLFNKGKIMKVFFENQKIIAINEFSEIAVTYDLGVTYNNYNFGTDTILAILKYEAGYLIRTTHSLLTLTSDFQKKNFYNLESKPLLSSRPLGYPNSMTIFKNNFIVETDSSKLIILTKELLPLDTITFSDKGFCKACWGYYQIYSDSVYFYNKIEDNIFRTKDLINFEKYYTDNTMFRVYKVMNNKFYVLDNTPFSKLKLQFYQLINKDSTIKLIDYKSDLITSPVNIIFDFNFYKNFVFFVGVGKRIYKADINNGAVQLISDGSRIDMQVEPDKINDSVFFYYKGGYNGILSTTMYFSENYGVTFKPFFSATQDSEVNKCDIFIRKFFDKKNHVIHLIGNASLLNNAYYFSNDNNALKFKATLINDYFEGAYWNKPYVPYLPNIPNLMKNKEYFVTAQNSINFNKNFSSLFYFTNDFKIYSMIQDTVFVINYIIESKDTNSFLIHCLNLRDSVTEIRETKNHGTTWEIFNSHPIKDSILFHKEFHLNEKNYFATFYYLTNDSTCLIEVFDIENRTVHQIYKFKISDFSNNSFLQNAIHSDGDTVYLVIKDTLFYITDLFDKNYWKNYILPNHGRIIRTFLKVNDSFYAQYQDAENDLNIYWIKIKKDIVKPKPMITSEDYDFGEWDVNYKDSLFKILKIYNKSSDADLKISGNSKLTDSAFSTNLPEINENLPLIIKPQNNFEFEVYFKPREVKYYIDSIIFYSNAIENDSVCYISGKGIDTSTVVIDYHTNSQNYLYCYPPYPNPTTNVVRSLIYWDTSIDIENDDIAVHDIFGNKVAGKEQITIDKQNTYSGLLTWDCSNVPDGIYLIRLVHGTKTWTMKVIVNR